MKIIKYLDVGPYTDADHAFLKDASFAMDHLPNEGERRYRIEINVPDYEPPQVVGDALVTVESA